MNDLDPGCVKLVEALNRLLGICTHESCEGHGKHPYHIWFKAVSLASLPPVLYFFDGCHSGYYDWRVLVKTDCAMAPVTFLVEGPVGLQGVRESEHIAELISDYCDDTARQRQEFECMFREATTRMYRPKMKDGINFARLVCPVCQEIALEKSSDLAILTDPLRYYFKCVSCGATGHVGWDTIQKEAVCFCHVQPGKRQPSAVVEPVVIEGPTKEEEDGRGEKAES